MLFDGNFFTHSYATAPNAKKTVKCRNMPILAFDKTNLTNKSVNT